MGRLFFTILRNPSPHLASPYGRGGRAQRGRRVQQEHILPLFLLHLPPTHVILLVHIPKRKEIFYLKEGMMKKKFWIAVLTAVLLLNILPVMTPSAAADDTSSLETYTLCKNAIREDISRSLGSFPHLSAALLTQSGIGEFLDVRIAVMKVRARAAKMNLDTLAEPKRPPAPLVKPARNAAVNTAYSATTGESGSPTAIIRRIPAPASAMAAARSKRKTAAEAMGPASRWARAPLAAGSTMAGMLFQHAGSGILTLK